ncbi:5196_t:CDS:2 [Funneliformis mosseae]|uniref:5196_t:CDS:1 n=1 Tax=Funneliformis mosseae TaxID=27381 RepID=A0A9N9CRE3_FUNMO|nr:5196_t:CDS:2 [Funneliformis mosseae]
MVTNQKNEGISKPAGNNRLTPVPGVIWIRGQVRYLKLWIRQLPADSGVRSEPYTRCSRQGSELCWLRQDTTKLK